MKKAIYTLLGVALLTSLISCGTTKEVVQEPLLEEEETETVEVEKEEEEVERPVVIGMPNPFITHDNLKEAQDAVGFTLALPSEGSIPSWVSTIVFKSTVVNMKMIEVIYAEDDSFANKEIRIRKALTDKEDISGDYNEYEEKETIDIGGKEVTLGKNKGYINLATWSDGEYKYSLSISNGADIAEVKELVEVIK